MIISVRPDGLAVRTARTRSSLTTDYKLVLVGQEDVSAIE